MKKDNISKNFIFQLLYQGIILVIPLMLSPYLTRTLQDNALGTFSFVNSIAYYFLILANLGISRHGQRIISVNADNEFELRKQFWSLFTLHAIISLFSVVLYLVYIIIFAKEDFDIYLIETLYVLSALFDITWLFYGLENFRSVVIKNGLVKIGECVLVFCLVKKPDDLWLYTMINALGILLGQIIMIPQAIRIVKPIRFRVSDFKPHVGPLMIFAISIIASTLYTVFDKTLLGIMSTKENVAYYEYSNRIINVPKTVISVIGTVLYPRACWLAAKGDVEGQKKYMGYSFFFTAMIGMGAFFGLLAVSQLFAIVYYGELFSECGSIMLALSPLVYIIGIGDIVRTQYMIPNHMDKQYTECIIINAIINIILSTLLIPRLGVYGAVVGTISAEIFGVIFQFTLCRKFIGFLDVIKPSIGFASVGLIMFILLKVLEVYIPYNAKGFLIEFSIGLVVFLVLASIYTAIFSKDLWCMLKSKIRIH